ncbi:hypothetical protein TTHN1_02111 [Thermus thermophilus]|uniref:Uncharacterized protein n=1 Tax=Thermus thermophilus TaxID=274 RepID=A0A3P4ATZ8_THETH|nr:hypothetical protein TTHN1_02111 [Thermus thermophilus]
MERFIREVRRGTKVRDHKFPKEEAVYKLLYLESERQEGRWAERKLKGFSEVKEVLEKMLQERYAPRTQTLIPFYANSFVLGHQWNRVCRLRVSGSWARTRHRSATASIISSRSRKYRLATASFTKGHTRSTGCSSGL